MHLSVCVCVDKPVAVELRCHATALICVCKNKGAAQRLCFRYIDSIICPLLKFKITSLWLYIPVCATTGPKPRRQVFSRWGAAVLHDGVVCVFCSLAVVPELTLPTNNSRQRLSKLINVGVRGRSKSRTMSRYMFYDIEMSSNEEIYFYSESYTFKVIRNDIFQSHYKAIFGICDKDIVC